jgi:hypothetical protein
MVVEFKYRPARSHGELIWRPVAEITIVHNDKKIHLSPYIDSGADITMIPKSAGELLGFNFEKDKIEELSGIGDGKVPVITKTVKMIIGNETFDCRIGWSLIEEVPPLLGRKDVFERFAVLFQEWDRKILFIPKSEFTGLKF